MNYRHAYHAGNAADVVKHIIIVAIIEQLKAKPKPFRVIDTHGGAGLYHLTSKEAEATNEWRSGIARVRTPESGDGHAFGGAARSLLAPYLASLTAASPVANTYPGSPLIAATLLRAGDRLIANELHRDDAQTLTRNLAPWRLAKALHIDGFQAIKAQLPPVERRGLVLIDPPFERADEFDAVAAGLRTGLKRFATGVFVIWYPIKDIAGVDAFLTRAVADLQAGLQTPLFNVTARFAAPTEANRLTACGLLIANPPYQLDARLRAGLPEIIEALAPDGGGSVAVDWLRK